MDERLLQQLEEMETELEAFQSALESIEESKELTKESALTLKESQVALSRACEDFIPVLQERFDNFATDSTTVQNKIEDLLTKLQSLDVHQFAEKLDNNGEYLTEQVTTKLGTQFESIKSEIDAAVKTSSQATESAIEKITVDSIEPLNQQVISFEKNLLKSQKVNTDKATDLISSKIKDGNATISTALTDAAASINKTTEETAIKLINNNLEPLNNKLETIESNVIKTQTEASNNIKADLTNQTELINSGVERIVSLEKSINACTSSLKKEAHDLQAIIKQTQTIGIVILVLSGISVILSAIRFFL